MNLHSSYSAKKICEFRCAAKYSNILKKLHGEFCRRFEDFKKVENEIHLLTCPFSSDVENAPCNLQLKLTELQSYNGLKEQFNSMMCVDF
jgi:17beta-estradiol 17-dehydrogenase/3beta-hydroxysteroid 3-dehydrogenase/mitotic-spindle organizing protein 1